MNIRVFRSNRSLDSVIYDLFDDQDQGYSVQINVYVLKNQRINVFRAVREAIREGKKRLAAGDFRPRALSFDHLKVREA